MCLNRLEPWPAQNPTAQPDGPARRPSPTAQPDSPARRPNPMATRQAEPEPSATEVRKRQLATIVDKPHWDQTEIDQALVKLFTVGLLKCGAHRCEEVEEG